MSNSKYSNALTILLIIAIIGVVGLLVFLGIDAFNKINLDKETSEGVAKFDELVPNVSPNQNGGYVDFDFEIGDNNSSQSANTTNTNDIVDPFSNTSRPTQNEQQEQSENRTTKKVYYKGFVQVGTIQIPRTGASLPVLEKSTKDALEVAAAIQSGPGLNEPGNTVIAGHNYHNGTLFSDNKDIKIGDKIYIKDLTGRTITYVAYEKYEVSDSDASYMIRNTEGKREIVLYSCNEDSSMRIVIHAREQ